MFDGLFRNGDEPMALLMSPNHGAPRDLAYGGALELLHLLRNILQQPRAFPVPYRAQRTNGFGQMFACLNALLGNHLPRDIGEILGRHGLKTVKTRHGAVQQ